MLNFLTRRNHYLLFAISLLVFNSPELRSFADDWPQWRGPNRDGVWNERGILEKFTSPTIDIRWRVPISAGYNGPTVADGRVYVMDRVVEPKEIERIHCFDWKTGETLWSESYDCPYKIEYPLGPRAAITLDDGRAYALGTMGNFHCLDAAKGHVLWKKDLLDAYRIRMPIWGIAAAPLVDNDLVILHIGGSDGACILALDKKTGQEKWRALDDPVSYSAPIIIQQAGRRVLVCWTGHHVAGLVPETGDVYWKYPIKPSQMVHNNATAVFHRNRLFMTAFFDGSLMLALLQDELKVEKIWRRKGRNERRSDALHSTITTPILEGDHVYGLGSYGQLRCLDAASGERVWEDLTAVPQGRWATLHLIRNQEKIWMFNELGELIISKLSPRGFHEISRAQLIEPTTEQNQRTNGVCWSHPAFAYRHVFARNDRELVCADLSSQ